MSVLSENAIKASPLWGHMVGVVKHLVQERPPNGIDAIIPASVRVERGDSVAAQVGAGAYERAAAGVAAAKVPVAQLHADCAANFCDALVPPRAKRPLFDDEEDEDYGGDAGGIGLGGGEMELGMDGMTEVQGELDDVVTQQRQFNAFGEGLSSHEAFRVAIGLKWLLVKEPLAKVRFWGKILCCGSGGYYIAEATVDEGRMLAAEEEEGMMAGSEDEEYDEEAEERARYAAAVSRVFNAHAAAPAPPTIPEEPGNPTGVNRYRYYVAATQDVTAWTLLPDLTPFILLSARSVNQPFTGNLNAPVRSIPAFPGLERDYLRAQIARISATCTVAPQGIFRTEGANPQEDEEEEEMGNSTRRGAEFSDKAKARAKVIPLVRAYEELPPLLPQEEPPEDDAEGLAAVASWLNGYRHDELLVDANWVHVSPTLLLNGRFTAESMAAVAERAAAAAAEAAEIDAAERMEDGEEVEDELNLLGGRPGDDGDDGGTGRGGIERFAEFIHPFLSPLSYDKQLSFPGHSKASFPAWCFRKAFRNPSSRTCAYIARSLLWPGAYTYAVSTDGVAGAEYHSTYVGNGMKSMQGALYAPPLPPMRMVEFREDGIETQRDGTADDELQYAQMPPTPPPASNDEESEVEEDDEGGDSEDN